MFFLNVYCLNARKFLHDIGKTLNTKSSWLELAFTDTTKLDFDQGPSSLKAVSLFPGSSKSCSQDVPRKTNIHGSVRTDPSLTKASV